MSLKLNFSCLSMGASVDQQTGNLSVFDVVEEIRTPQVPAHVPSLVISLTLEHVNELAFNGKVFIHVLTPDGQQQMVGSGELRVPPEQKRVKAVFRFGAFPVLSFGAHRFVVSLMDEDQNKQAEAVLDFDVVKVTQVAQGVLLAEKPGVIY